MTTHLARRAGAALALIVALLVAAPAAGAAQDPLHVMSFNLQVRERVRVAEHVGRAPAGGCRAQLHPERPACHRHAGGSLPAGTRRRGQPATSGYDSIGLGREGGSRGEAMQVFFDSQRLAPPRVRPLLAVGHARRGRLEDVGRLLPADGHLGALPRRAHRRARSTSFNTHLEAFDAVERGSRPRGLLAQQAERRSTPPSPSIVTGDFNEPADARCPVCDLLVRGPLVGDSWLEAGSRGAADCSGPGTTTGRRCPAATASTGSSRRPGVRTNRASVNTFPRDGDRWASDHLPVQAVLRLP